MYGPLPLTLATQLAGSRVKVGAVSVSWMTIVPPASVTTSVSVAVPSGLGVTATVFEVGGAPVLDQPQRLSHLCYRTEGGWTVVDVWEDEASFAALGGIIGPATAAAGLDAKPLVYPLVGTIAQDGTRSTY